MKHGLWTCCLVTALMTSFCMNEIAFAQDNPAQTESNALVPVDETAPSAPEKSIYEAENLKPRDIYNLALEQLNGQKFETAIEGFLRARDTAESIDHELRYSASYNLAYSFARKAEAAGDINALEAEQLQGVIDDLTNSVAWFRDAVRQHPNLQESAGNLEITLKRLLAARDVMAQKYNTLEKQLEEVLATERTIRENARVLSENITRANAERDPLVFADAFNSLVSIQREALTQANLIAENLDSELAALENSANDQQEDNSKGFRVFQLKSASPLLETARQAMASARRQMREAAMNDALRLTNKAFNYLKQTREQLDNPLSVLNHIAEDENGFLRFATAKYMFSDPEKLEQYKAAANRDDLQEPVWLNNDLLTDNQVDTLIRTNRVIEFLKNVTEAAAQQPQNAQQNPEQAEAAQQQIEQIKDALPFIQNAASLMQSVTQNLEINDYKSSVENASKSIEQLAMAMERFADLKHLIEIAYASQMSTEPLIRGEIGGETPQLLSRIQQREMLAPILEVNADRLERLATLLAKDAAKATQSQGQNGQQMSEEQRLQIQKVFEQAEILRQNASDAVKRMAQTLSTPAAEDIDETIVPGDISEAVWSDLTGDAEIAQKSLEQLRMIFFTIIEHIQELLKQQVSTMDQTTDSATGKPEEIEMTLPPIIDRQHQHELMSDQLAQELIKQAEQLQAQAGQQQPGGPDPAEMAQRYREAASELQAASTVMRQAQTDLSNPEHLFNEALEEQKTAAEHIQKALELLQPPQQQQQKQQQQNQDQNQDQQQQQQQQQSKMSKEQAEKKIQEIRSRDKERRKSKDEKRAAGMPIIEKDW